MLLKLISTIFIFSCHLLLAQDTLFEIKTDTASTADTDEMYYDGSFLDTTNLVDNHTLYLKDSINKHNFNKQKWQEITKDIDYTEFEKKQKTATVKSGKNKPKPKLTDNFWKSFAKVALVVIAILVIAFVLYKLLKGNLFISNKEITDAVFNIDKIEENMHHTDLLTLLDKIIEQKNYRLAVRIYYLIVIKELSLIEWIKWKKDKTNYEYLNEMADKNVYPDFRTITYTFEYIWYGEYPIDEEIFMQIAPKFKSFISNIKSSDNINE